MCQLAHFTTSAGHDILKLLLRLAPLIGLVSLPLALAGNPRNSLHLFPGRRVKAQACGTSRSTAAHHPRYSPLAPLISLETTSTTLFTSRKTFSTLIIRRRFDVATTFFRLLPSVLTFRKPNSRIPGLHDSLTHHPATCHIIISPDLRVNATIAGKHVLSNLLHGRRHKTRTQILPFGRRACEGGRRRRTAFYSTFLCGFPREVSGFPGKLTSLFPPID